MYELYFVLINVKANGIEDPDVIQIGEKLYIPKFVKMPARNYA